MKKTKLFYIVLTALMTVLLVACGQKQEQPKEQVTHFQRISPTQKVDIRISYYHNDDDVTRQVTKTNLSYIALGVTDKEGARAKLEPGSAKYQNIKGVKEKITYHDDHIIEDLEVDYTTVNFEELAKADNTFANMKGDNSNISRISLKLSRKFLEDNQFKEVKDGKFENLQ